MASKYLKIQKFGSEADVNYFGPATFTVEKSSRG